MHLDNGRSETFERKGHEKFLSEQDNWLQCILLLSKFTKLIKNFYSNWSCTDFLQDHSVPFFNSNMMLCGACRLTLYRHKHNTHPAPQQACFR